MSKLGLIAGGGGLPIEVVEACRENGRPLFVVRLRGFADPRLAAYEGEEIGLAELGRCIRALKRAECAAVCMAGLVARPDFGALKPDLRGLAALPGAIAAARKGDDALLRYLLHEFEKEGFAVEGAHEAAGRLTLPAGALGRFEPDAGAASDAVRALETARAIGRLDIGQAAVVCRGLVLAVEAQEGTAAMLARVAGLPEALRGAPGVPAGVLAKAPKPIQETRVDMPAIGPETIRAAATAGLAGVVGEAGRLLVIERETVAGLADELGLFVVGLEPTGE
jgi:DUF1009 family protein